MGQLECQGFHAEQSINNVVPTSTHLLSHPLAVAAFYEIYLVWKYKQKTLSEARVHERIGAECLADKSRLDATDNAHGWVINQFGVLGLAVDNETDVRPDG